MLLVVLTIAVFAHAADEDELVVAVYKYVPRLDQMKDTLTEMWAALNTSGNLPRLSLHDWDCYREEPPKGAEVIVYDILLLANLQSMGIIQSIPQSAIDNSADLLPFLTAATDARGDQAVGIPQLVCTDVAYYRTVDHALASAASYLDFLDVIGPHPNAAFPFGDSQGLYFDLSSSITASLLYLMADMILSGNYTADPLLPPIEELDIDALDWLSRIASAGGQAQVSEVTEGRLPQLAHGSGRASVSFTELLGHYVPTDLQEPLTARKFPLGPNKSGYTISFFNVDIASLTADVDASASEYGSAVKLLNLMTSTEYLTSMSLPTANNTSPQYLLFPRKSAYSAMNASGFARYSEFYDMITGVPNPQVVRAGPQFPSWNASVMSYIRDNITTSRSAAPISVQSTNPLAVIIGVAVGIGVLVVAALATFLICRARRLGKRAAAPFQLLETVTGGAGLDESGSELEAWSEDGERHSI